MIKTITTCYTANNWFADKDELHAFFNTFPGMEEYVASNVALMKELGCVGEIKVSGNKYTIERLWQSQEDADTFVAHVTSNPVFRNMADALGWESFYEQITV